MSASLLALQRLATELRERLRSDPGPNRYL